MPPTTAGQGPTPSVNYEPWIENLIPGLQTRWNDHFSSAPANQPVLALNDWLTLLQTAATAPWKISDQLSHLLNAPKSSLELQHSWGTLANLFTLTFEAGQSAVPELEPTAWQKLLEIQNRVLKHSAQVLVREDPLLLLKW